MMSETITNILLVGVGGQGILLASEILAEAFIAGRLRREEERDPRHVAARRQRRLARALRPGRSARRPCRKGRGTSSSVSSCSRPTAICSLLRPGAEVVVNDYRIAPPSVLLGQATYPDDIPAERDPAPASPISCWSTGCTWRSRPATCAPPTPCCSVRCRSAWHIAEPVWQQALDKDGAEEGAGGEPQGAFAMGRAL
ncbi:MAG: hypothetical protein MZU79_01305 [Anaerotruncus sp.]|nr:hypothetical protein [Anaerotruncus sp.]